MLKVANSVISASRITGVLPVVNGGTGVTTSTGTGNTVLSATPTLSGDVTLSTGNLIVASGQGIDFSATPNTGTSELLADYEEGTFTVGMTRSDSTGFTYTPGGSDSGVYTKIGRQVFVRALFSGTFSGGLGAYRVTGLPFAPSAGNNSWFPSLIVDGSLGTSGTGVTFGTEQILTMDFTPISGNVWTAAATYNV